MIIGSEKVRPPQAIGQWKISYCQSCGRSTKQMGKRHPDGELWWWCEGVLSAQKHETTPPNWKGDKVGYSALHEWVKRMLGKPRFCEHCKRTDKIKYEWANKSHSYRRDVNDWVRLCTLCHHKYDLTFKKTAV